MIAVQFVRKKYNEKTEKMSDKEIQNILNFLYVLCNKIIDITVTKSYPK
jgi:hypothetical protein